MSNLKEIEVNTTLDNKNVVWIDQNNNGPENKIYLKICSEALKNFSFKLVTSVKEGYECLSKFHFELVYVILSGRLAEEFLDIYEENLQKLDIITLNIIFCFNKKFHELKKYANDPFYNPGGVVSEFEKVIEFLKKDEKYKLYKIIENEKNFYNSEDIIHNNFIFVEKTDENIAFPIILKKFSSYFIKEEDLEKFKRFLLLNYYKQIKDRDNRIINILNPKIKIPYYFYSKIFVRLYTMESQFYKDLANALLNNNLSDFRIFILTLYNGLNRKVLEDVHNKPLYRFANIKKEEYDKIINSPNKLLFTRKFLSFSEDFDVNFFNINKVQQILKPILFVINPLKEDINERVTNINTQKISYYSLEKEVVFLPFSGFEISEPPKKKDDYTIIYLNYLNKYEKKIKDYIDARSKDNVEKFLKSLINESKKSIYKSIIKPEFLELIKDYGDKKPVLWIDQYSRCKLYEDYLLKYSLNLNNFYFEKATTVKEAFLILSNYEFKLVYIIINEKLSKEFFLTFDDNIKKLSLVTANIIFCENKSQLNEIFINDSFLNPGGVVTEFSKVVEYLNNDENGFEKILKLKKTIDKSFIGKDYGNIFKEIDEKQIVNPIKMIQKIILNLPDQESISKFKNFIYKYGNKNLSKVANPNLEKKINLPLFIYPKFYMRMYGLETDFYKDLNKYLSNKENDFGIYNTFITILYYGLYNNFLISNDEIPLYRGGVISKKEFKILEENFNSKKKIFYSSKNFLSFSKDENEANKFIDLYCDNSLFPVKFIIEKYEKDENSSNLISNVEMRHYSGIATEKEVLFLPLSSFKVTYIDEITFQNQKIKIIKLNYVGGLLDK